ncbi:MAG: site-specific DNA-methyltransferase [Planctomycetes bacterium]|nr:site-specific DNA-methyltransferase [Planctomycetota bacterium]
METEAPENIEPTPDAFSALLPPGFINLQKHQTELPRIAKDPKLISQIEMMLRSVETRHRLYRHDARDLDYIPDGSVHLIVTSPPYWTLKEYRQSPGQLGSVEDYEEFLIELDKVWQHCFRVLVPGGRLIIVVGDVCLSRRKNQGRHTVVPLHASIQEHCRKLGFDNLAPIIWSKIANASFEVENGSSFLGKPYEPNAVIKNDIEFIVMERKPGGYRSPSVATRVLSVISTENYQKWFRQIWTDVPGASTKDHPAPFPVDLAERLIRMFSFVGDTVLDPFAGTFSTIIAAMKVCRNSIGNELDPQYFKFGANRVRQEAQELHGFFSALPQVEVIQATSKISLCKTRQSAE